MSKRIYLVSNGDTKTLVNASSRAQAMNYIARQTIKIGVATQHELVTLLQSGHKVCEAVETQDDLPLEGEE